MASVATKPTDGKYTLCSKMTSLIGITEDSTDKAIKKKKIPKELSRSTGKSHMPAVAIEHKKRKDSTVGTSQKVVETG
jgi:hypothetical protein